MGNTGAHRVGRALDAVLRAAANILLFFLPPLIVTFSAFAVVRISGHAASTVGAHAMQRRYARVCPPRFNNELLPAAICLSA